jgi:ribonuclease E
VESSALHILRIMQEEAMKENTAAVHAQVPVDVATFLLNEKRADIHTVEARLRVDVVLIPNIHLETPHYTVTRYRHDEMNKAEPLPASYQLMEKPAEEEVPGLPEARPERPEAAVKGITPEQPAPIPVEAQPRPEPEPAPAPAALPQAAPRPSLWRRFLGIFAAPEQPVPAPAAQPAAPAPEARERRERRPERHRERGERREGRGERGQRPHRGEGEGRRERPDRGQRGRPEERREGREQREPREPRPPREGREQREPREPRPPREGREQREPRERPQPESHPPAVMAPVEGQQPQEAHEGRGRRRRRRGRGEGRPEAAPAVPPEAHAMESGHAVEITGEEPRAEAAPRRHEPEPVPAEAAPQPQERPAEPAPRPHQTEMFTPVDLATSGLELVETIHRADTPAVAPEEPAAPVRRPRRERAPAAPAETVELEQVETRRPADTPAE